MRRDLETLHEVAAHVAAHGTLDGVLVRDLDLRGMTEVLRGVSAVDAVLMGCGLPDPVEADLVEHGALVFPPLDGVPYHPYRRELYSVDELMEGYVRGDPESFGRDTLDSRIYEHYTALRRAGALPLLQAFAQRLHDHAMDRALREVLDDGPRRTVGVMGGHAMRRDEPGYRAVAQLGRQLSAAGYYVATGGGPGAMEAANLGAWHGAAHAAVVDAAVDQLAAVTSWRDPRWFDTAWAVREAWPDGAASLGIPTWFYGHEPTNLFATHVAKFFANSLREDGLLAIALHGVVYAPGSAGTVQEVFQDAAQNHYGTFSLVSPMVFLGVDAWTRRLPVLPLLRSLAGERQYAERILVTDDVDEIVTFLQANPPVPYNR